MRSNQQQQQHGQYPVGGHGAQQQLSQSNSALRQSSVDQAPLSSGKNIDRTPAMTPVQQKYGQSHLFHSAAINNYLTSGSRMVEATPQQVPGSNNATTVHQKGRSVNQSSQQQLQMNQFNRSSLKKSEIKQLQKYCEQNGLDISIAAYDRSILVQGASGQPMQQPQPQSKSLSKERKFVNAQNIAGGQTYFPQTNTSAGSAKVQVKIQGNHHQHNNVSQIANQRVPSKNSQNKMLQQQQQQQYTSHAQQYGLYQSSSTALLDNSPLKKSKLASQVSQLQMVNYQMQGNTPGLIQSSSAQHVLASNSSKPSSSRGKSGGTSANASSQAKRASDWKKPQMMPSQMSINDSKNLIQAQSQEATAHLAHMLVNQKGYHHMESAHINSASQGYLSQKASPLGRLSVERPHNPLNDNFKGKVTRYQYLQQKNGANTQSGKASVQQQQRRASQDNAAVAELQTAYLNQKALQIGASKSNSNSASSLDNKFQNHRQIDSGAGVISLNNSSVASVNQQRQPRGVNADMKSALQSRRKHGSIDTYTQNGESNVNSQAIRQGQGEIVPQRGLGSNKHSVQGKNLGVAMPGQLPKVVRSQTNQSSVKTNASSGLPSQGGVSRPQERIQNAHSSSIISSSNPMITNSNQKMNNARLSSPSDEKKYQAPQQTNALRHSALSRGSVKQQSSQQALSSSNHMNLSLSQASSRGLPKSHKDSSVEHLQERRIAYEASQGKLGAAKKDTSSEMVLAQSHGKVSVNNPQNQGGNVQRHARMRTNHSSVEKEQAALGANYHGHLNKNADLVVNSQKRGAITLAKNSPRHSLAQMKGNQPRLPNSMHREDFDRHQHGSAPQQQEGQANPVSEDPRYQRQNVKEEGKQAGPQTPPTKEHLPTELIQGGQMTGRRHTYVDSNGVPILDEEYLAYLQQQQSAMSRYEENAGSSIEQYSRKLQTPNPILDGGTGSGGAITLQHQTRQLLKEQQLMLEKLGYKSQSNFMSEPQNRITVSKATQQHHQNDQALKNLSQGFNIQPQSQVQGIEGKVSLKQSQRSLGSSKQMSQKHSSNQAEQKKSTLLGHKIQQQNKKEPKGNHDGSGNTKVLNLSNNISGGAAALAKQASTKTSAQTANTAFTVKVNNPQYVQYSGGKNASNAPSQSSHLNKNASLRLKKSSGNSQPASNLIMYQQQVGKRSNSQEMLNNVNEVQLNIALRSSLVVLNQGQDQKRHKALKGEKRSSSQPTQVQGSQEIINQPAGNYLGQNNHQNQQVPKYSQQKHQVSNKRLSDDQTSRQRMTNGMRSSQQTTSNPQQSSQQNISTGKQHQAYNFTKGHLHHNNQQPYQFNVGVAREKAQLEQRHERVQRRHNTDTAEQHQAQNRSKRLRKQASVPQLAISRPDLNKQNDQKQSEYQQAHHGRKAKSNGPGRPQYSVNQPHAVAAPDTILSTGQEKDHRLITEDDEQEIRQVASDINEKAFYGKIIRTKKALNNEGEFSRLSPRSQEIGYVMQKLERAFALTGQPPITDITFYRIGKMLGRGAFGKVNLAMHKLVRKLVALKSLNKSALTDEVQKAKQMKEVNLLQKLRHNHVVKIYETIETQKHIIIVMELCAGGDLLNYVRKRRRLKEPFAQKIFRQIIEGLGYIHSKNVAHRDIKLDNILLDGKGNVKIADFGVSRQIQPDQIMREQCGTPAYIAPEILRNRGYSLNVDLWSAGVVLFAMLYGTVPFKAQTMDELHQVILKGKYLLKEDISIEARDLLRGLLEINPKKRLSVRKILRHPWLKNMDTSVQLFNDEERKMIKKEYTYNDGSRYNRNENEEPVDCFTLHHLESQYSTLKNQDSKSIILAPFNSTMSEQSTSQMSDARSKVMQLMEVKQQVLRFSKKCREIDRQYEFNNNGQLDNGVYHKVVANNSFEQQDKYEETQGIEIEQSLIDSFKERARRGKSQGNARNDHVLTASEQSSFLTMAEQYQIQHNLQKPLDPSKIQKLVQFGYPEPYVMEQMRDMVPNYCSAGYYLLEMDQNYC